MGTEAHGIVDLAATCHLREATLPRPGLGGLHKLPAEPLATQGWLDIPALNIANARAGAPCGVVSHTRLQKSTQARPATINHKGSQVRTGFSKERCDLALMVVRRPWPEKVPHPQPFGAIAGNDTSDSHTTTHPFADVWLSAP